MVEILFSQPRHMIHVQYFLHSFLIDDGDHRLMDGQSDDRRICSNYSIALSVCVQITLYFTQWYSTLNTKV